MNIIKDTDNIHKTALLVSIACVLQIAESLIPHPVPGLRLGLGNVVTLIALATMGFGAALEITVLRTILSAFIMGTFMSPSFILSVTAGVMSTLVMGGLYAMSRSGLPVRLGMVGISVLGALTHNVDQLSLAYLILIKHPGIFVFLPWLAIGSVVTGWMIGAVAGRVCLELKSAAAPLPEVICGEETSLRFEAYVPGDSFLHRVSAAMKIGGILLLSGTVILVAQFWFYAVLFALLFIVLLAARVPPVFLLINARKYFLMIAVALLFPVLFSTGTQVLMQYGIFRITVEGVMTGGLFALRILFLVYLSALLARTTAPADLAGGLGKLLRPLSGLGISGDRTARIFSLSWMATPVLWAVSKQIIRSLELRTVRDTARLIPLLSTFMTRFYREADRQGFWAKETYA